MDSHLRFFRYLVDSALPVDSVGRIARRLQPDQFGLQHCLSEWATMEKAPLSAAARVVSMDPSKLFERCKCKRGCDSNRCLCRKAGLTCGPKCHPTEKRCANRSPGRQCWYSGSASHLLLYFISVRAAVAKRKQHPRSECDGCEPHTVEEAKRRRLPDSSSETDVDEE